MTYSMEVLSESNIDLWEEFNRQSPGGTLFHSIQWKAFLEEALHLRLKYYLILDEQKVIGICPCVEKSIKLLRGLGSIPHTECNNIILDESLDSDSINEVLALFSKDYSFLHFSTYDPAILDRIGYRTIPNDEEGNMMLDLVQKPPDLIWRNNLSKDDRYKISRFEKGGFEVREVEHERDFERFYHHYAENLFRINGRIHPPSFFSKLLETYSQNSIRMVMLTNGDTFAGGNLAMLHPERKTAYFEYLALNRNLPNKYSPGYALFWEGINWAWEHGYERISFGRESLDPGVGSFKNKVRFGAEYVPIYPGIIILSRGVSYIHRLKGALSGV